MGALVGHKNHLHTGLNLAQDANSRMIAKTIAVHEHLSLDSRIPLLARLDFHSIETISIHNHPSVLLLLGKQRHLTRSQCRQLRISYAICASTPLTFDKKLLKFA